MNVENIIRAWKAEEEEWEAPVLASPVGRELTEEELLEISGGDPCFITVCGTTCNMSCTVSVCGFTCGVSICNVTN